MLGSIVVILRGFTVSGELRPKFGGEQDQLLSTQGGLGKDAELHTRYAVQEGEGREGGARPNSGLAVEIAID